MDTIEKNFFEPLNTFVKFLTQGFNTHVESGTSVDQNYTEIESRTSVHQNYTESVPSVDHYSVTLGKIFEDLYKTTVTAQDFETKARAHESTYLEKINFDPLQANYWKDYNNLWELDQQEIHKLQNNGFVVSEHLGTKSFGTAYLAIYNHHLPVFITADSMLHVWHKAYDGMLEDLEKSTFTEMIYKILQAIHTALPKTSKNTLLFQAIKDIEYFILVALNLLISDKIYKEEDNKYSYRKEVPRTPPTPSSPEVGVNVEKTLEAIKNMQMQKFTLFGRARDMDFSQFKPRGHYENSIKLRRYFMCMMWLGRIDLRIAGGEEGDSNLLELGIALFMNNILSKLPEFKLWKVFDKIMQTLVGSTDSLTFRDLNDFVVNSGIPSNIEKIFTEEKLREIQQVIEKTNLGNQSITSHVYEKDVGTGPRKIPRAFTFLGQRYTMDSWVLGQLVSNIEMRPIPSCVDVGYTVFGNNTCAPILNERMKTQSGIKFRDGISFQSEISALRGTLDMLPENIWHDNLYTLWLKAIRCLSNASGNENAKKFPQIMRTKMWAQKDLETQFASWSQLRHDTVLYAKQSYSCTTSCDYPAGFVDPRVEFWDVLVEMGERVKEISALIEKENYFQGEMWSTKWLKATKTLRNLAQKELDQIPFSENESAWIKNTIHKYYKSGSGGGWKWDGWYCHLFWEGAEKSEKFEPTVADVHTAPPRPDFGGTVLMEGVGSVNMMVAAVDNGNNLTMYAGPVFSHFEIIPDGIVRLSDSEWEKVVTEGPGGKDGNMLNYPEWAREYLVTSRPQVGPDPRVSSDSGYF